MDAQNLYQQLEHDFIHHGMWDDWARHMQDIQEFVSENFRQRSMGLVCDFAKEISQVYTAVFPSPAVMRAILDDKARDAMLFVHHPAVWDIRKAPQVWQDMDRDLLQQFKDRQISIYNLHVPLDHYGEYGTSKTLAHALGVRNLEPFAPYRGALAGVFGKTSATTVQELQGAFAQALGHETRLYLYGDAEIRHQSVAVVAGGGTALDILQEVEKAGVNVLLTGITAKNDHSKDAHAFAKEKRINLLGGTHYSTERFACQAMVDYYSKQGLQAKFIPGEPILEDM